MKLTEEEKELILKKRAEKKAAEPIKSGVLRHDLFEVDSYGGNIEIEIEQGDLLDRFLTVEKIEEVAAICREQLFGGYRLPKGSRFFCYLKYGAEEWAGDSGYSGYRFDRCWAAEHLENIKEIEGDN